MALAQQTLVVRKRTRKKKSGRSRGTAKRITITKTRTHKHNGKITTKKKHYSGKPSRLPRDW